MDSTEEELLAFHHTGSAPRKSTVCPGYHHQAFEDDDRPLDQNILDMPFDERWELVGSRPSSSLPSSTPNPRAESAGLGGYMHLVNSFKLNTMSRPDLRTPQMTASRSPQPEPILRSPPTRMLNDRRRQENGSPDRICKQAARNKGASVDSVLRSDAVNDVEKAMAALQSNDKAKLKHLKRGRMSRINLGAAIEKRDPNKCSTQMKRGRRQSMLNTRGERFALSEFSQWCSDTFGGFRPAWAVLDQLCKRSITQQEFRDQLQRCRYPTGDLGLKNVFHHLDTDDDGIVHEDEFLRLLRTHDSRKSKPTTPASPQQKCYDLMDPIEEKVVAAAGKSRAEAHANIIERVQMHDPIIAQFIAYMLNSFGSIKMAYKRMDVNGNGSIAKGEFQDTMRALQSNSGERPVQAHMLDLFARLDITESGFITLNELVNNIQSEDSMLHRLHQWASAPNTHNGHASVLSEAALKQEFMKAFRLVGGRDRIKCQDFLSGLARLRYHEWHVSDLWRRLDIDKSGQLTIGEFTAFIYKDAPTKRIWKEAAPPLGTEARQETLAYPYRTMGGSTKLAIKELVRRTEPKVGSRLKATQSEGCLNSSPWETLRSPTGTSEIHLKRAFDNLGAVQSNVRCGSSELRHRGRHVLTASSEPSLDLSSGPCALNAWDERAERTRMF